MVKLINLCQRKKRNRKISVTKKLHFGRYRGDLKVFYKNENRDEQEVIVKDVLFDMGYYDPLGGSGSESGSNGGNGDEGVLKLNKAEYLNLFPGIKLQEKDKEDYEIGGGGEKIHFCDAIELVFVYFELTDKRTKAILRFSDNMEQNSCDEIVTIALQVVGKNVTDYYDAVERIKQLEEEIISLNGLKDNVSLEKKDFIEKILKLESIINNQNVVIANQNQEIVDLKKEIVDLKKRYG